MSFFIRGGIHALECLLSNQCYCKSIDFIMKQEMNQHCCNFIGWWDYIVKRINGNQTPHDNVGVFHTLNNRNWCTRALSSTLAIFCVLPEFPDYVLAGKAQVKFAAQGQPVDCIGSRCNLGLQIRWSSHVSPLLFSLTLYVSSILTALLPKQRRLLLPVPSRVLPPPLAPPCAHSAVNHTDRFWS